MTAAITFDVDWAPDWAIEDCAQACAKHSVPATFFATNTSPFLTELLQDSRFEVGIHPNFCPGSSHGEDPAVILAHCLEMAPEARVMRTHDLFQRSALLSLVGNSFPQIEIDVSLLLPFHRGLQPTLFPAGSRTLLRLPYCWEDDIAAAWPGWRWDAGPLQQDGLVIYDFHPILVALNTSDLAGYRALKGNLNGRSLWQLERDDVRDFRHAGIGNADYLQQVIEGAADYATISQLAGTLQPAGVF